jgi:hypothetical protein
MKGSEGILCGSCEDGYTFSNALSLCVECDSSPNLVPMYIFAAIGFMGMVAGVLRLCGLRLSAKSEMGILQVLPFSLLKHVDKGMMKVAWSTFQIVSTIAWNLSVKYPEPFASVRFGLDALQIDFLSLDCVAGKANFFNRVLLVSLFPIGVALINFAVFLFRWLSAVAASRGSLSSSSEKCAKVSSQHMWAFLLLTYMVLPPCSMVQFQVFGVGFFACTFFSLSFTPSCTIYLSLCESFTPLVTTAL